MSDESPRHHLLVAGQGRSGTSLLVKVLSACGLDTQLERRGDEAWWSEAAKAGLEDTPYSDNAPYVIKSPYAYQFLEQGLHDERFVLDHAIIPLRRLREGAASRVITELANLLTVPNMATTVAGGGMWEHFGRTPGGVTYSLHEVDAERILATGFTRLVEILVRHDVPMTFLDFPRFVQRPEYLYDRLAPLLEGLSLAEFQERIEPIIDTSLIRVEGELAASESGEVNPREVAALRRALADVSAARDELAAECDAQLAERCDEMQRNKSELASRDAELRELRRAQAAELRELRRTQVAELRAVRNQLDQRRAEVREQGSELRALRAEVAQRDAEIKAADHEVQSLETTKRDTELRLLSTESRVANLRKRLREAERDADAARRAYERVSRRRLVRAALRLAQPTQPVYRAVRAVRSKVARRGS